jgi:hypothetical protein
MCFTFSVIAFPWMLELVWLLYMRMDFTHARILIVGLLPLPLIVDVLLADLAPQGVIARRSLLAHAAIAFPLAVLVVSGIDLPPNHFRAIFLCHSYIRGCASSIPP